MVLPQGGGYGLEREGVREGRGGGMGWREEGRAASIYG